jgi:esterase/lipase
VLRYPNLVDELLRRGYHVLGACYFDRDEKYSIPHDLINIRVESFVEEINKYTAAHADVIDADSIGVLGISKGGELSLLLASLYPIFKFVIPIVPSHVVFQGSSISLSHHSSWMLNGKELPFLPFANYSPKTWMCGLSYGAAMIGVISGTMVNCGPMHFASMQDEEALEEATIKVENINGPIFFVSAKEDQFWPSAALSDLAIERVNKRGFRHPVKNLAEPGDHFSYDNHWEIILDAMDAAAQYARDGDAAKCQQKFDEAVGHAST